VGSPVLSVTGSPFATITHRAVNVGVGRVLRKFVDSLAA
jgi:hypothetical protein